MGGGEGNYAPAMTSVADLARDLEAEQAALDAVVAPLTDDQWSLATPSPGWSVADQIGHLGYFDRTAAMAITDPESFAAETERLMGSGSAMDDTLAVPRTLAPADLLTWWREARDGLRDAAAGLDEDARLVWYGPPMGAKSFLTARLMEAWAHGQDVCDAVGARREATHRLRHIAQLGFITRGWSYIVRGETPPDSPLAVELAAPSGEAWHWGDPAAAERIEGPAEDFCLVVTQRRHVADTALTVTGDSAADWMDKAQAFAGGATDGPAPT